MATTYRIRFNNVEEQAVECTFTDETGDLDIIDIEGAEDAVRIVSQDNDENKYSPIKAKKCVIKFLNSQAVNLRTFATGEDNKWLVTVKINSLTVFIGHLEQGDIEEPFQYEENQIVVLTATDGLGLLKTHRLEDIFAVWTGGGTCGIVNENRIIDYIAACLAATKLSLTINVINNLREEDNPVTDTATFGNIYAALYLDIKTWEDNKVGSYINSYDILEKILGHDCYLTQAKGMWWIVRVTELRQDFDMMKTVFDFNGDVLSFETLNYEKAIGLKDVNNTPFPGTPDASAYFSQDKTLLSLERPVKSVTLRYNFENPFEVLANAALQRGAFIADLPDEVDLDGNTLTVKSFEIDCWDYRKYTSTDPPVLTTQDSNAYVKVRYSNGHEVERYIHIEATAAWPAQYRLVNLMRIKTHASDRFDLSFAFKWSADLGGAKPYSVRVAEVRLYADDGSFWAVQGGNQGSSNTADFWMETDSNFKALVPIGVIGYPSLVFGVEEGIDLTNWNNGAWNIPAAPRSGQLEIVLLRESENSTATDRDVSAINLSYHPFIAGAYDLFTSQADTSTRDGEYISSIEDEVFITNAPRPILKGALLKPSGGDFVIVGQFYEGQQFDGTGGAGEMHSYGELRVRAFHNQFRNGDEIYRLVAQGLGEGAVDGDGADDHPDIIHRYFNRDIEPTTNDQAFQLVAQDVDLRNCEWSGTLIKNFDIGTGFVDDTYDFSYGATGSAIGGGGGGGGGGGTVPAVRFGVSGEDDTAAEDRSFDMTGGDWTFSYLGDSGNTFPLIQVSGGTQGISAKGSYSGVYGQGDTIGGQFESGNLPLWANYTGAEAADFKAALEISREGAFNGVTGEETGIVYNMYDDTGSVANPGNEIIGWQDATSGAMVAYYRLQLANGLGLVPDIIRVSGSGFLQFITITATAASAITPAEGMILFVNSTNGTFTSIGLWDFENGAWHKL